MEEVKFTKAAAKLYRLLYVAAQDVGFAGYCAGVLIKRGWHSFPWERRGTIYLQQSAFTTACLTAYARPFIHRGDGWSRYVTEVLDRVYDQHERVLHQTFEDLRHSVYAHSDPRQYRVRPTMSGGYQTDIIGQPFLRLDRDQAAALVAMVSKSGSFFREQRRVLRQDFTTT